MRDPRPLKERLEETGNPVGSAFSPNAEKEPMSEGLNVLVLVCDHHRFDALGCLGNPLARTPNLDRLVGKSVRFENCFTQSPVCSPARHSMATGQRRKRGYDRY